MPSRIALLRRSEVRTFFNLLFLFIASSYLSASYFLFAFPKVNSYFNRVTTLSTRAIQLVDIQSTFHNLAFICGRQRFKRGRRRTKKIAKSCGVKEKNTEPKRTYGCRISELRDFCCLCSCGKIITLVTMIVYRLR